MTENLFSWLFIPKSKPMFCETFGSTICIKMTIFLDLFKFQMFFWVFLNFWTWSQASLDVKKSFFPFRIIEFWMSLISWILKTVIIDMQRFDLCRRVPLVYIAGIWLDDSSYYVSGSSLMPFIKFLCLVKLFVRINLFSPKIFLSYGETKEIP